MCYFLTVKDRKTNILIIDDDEKFIIKAKDTLSYLGDISIDEGYSEADFYSFFKPGKYNAIILDLRLRSGYEGMELLEYALNEDPTAPIIVLTGYASIETAIKSLKLGAKDYLEKTNYKDKPFLSMIEKIIIEDKARKLAEQMVAASATESQILGNDVKIKRILKFADWLAEERESPILLVGEEGTEKEEIAEYIYKKSSANGRFIKKIIEPDEKDLQNEFLYDDKNPGLIKQAQGGVLYLDEVFRLNKKTQQKILDFINTGILKSENKKQGQKIKVQLILATSQSFVQIKENKNLDTAFYYRVKSPELFIPPLRERGDDIVLLAQYYISSLKSKGKGGSVAISDEVTEICKKYHWPGNLLELKQVIESSTLKAKLDESRTIKVKHLPFDLQKGILENPVSEQLNLDKILAKTTLEYMKIALDKSNGAKIDAYKHLGYPESKRGTLNSRFKKIFETFPDLAGVFPEIYKLYMAK